MRQLRCQPASACACNDGCACNDIRACDNGGTRRIWLVAQCCGCSAQHRHAHTEKLMRARTRAPACPLARLNDNMHVRPNCGALPCTHTRPARVLAAHAATTGTEAPTIETGGSQSANDVAAFGDSVWRLVATINRRPFFLINSSRNQRKHAACTHTRASACARSSARMQQCPHSNAWQARRHQRQKIMWLLLATAFGDWWQLSTAARRLPQMLQLLLPQLLLLLLPLIHLLLVLLLRLPPLLPLLSA